MSPMQFQQSLIARHFTMESGGRWHGPWGLTVEGTWNTITTNSLADSARAELIRQIDAALAVKQRDYNAK